MCVQFRRQFLMYCLRYGPPFVWALILYGVTKEKLVSVGFLCLFIIGWGKLWNWKFLKRELVGDEGIPPRQIYYSEKFRGTYEDGEIQKNKLKGGEKSDEKMDESFTILGD